MSANTPAPLKSEYELHWLCVRGDIAGIHRLLTINPDMDIDRTIAFPHEVSPVDKELSFDFAGMAPIHIAMARKNLELLKTLDKYDVATDTCLRARAVSEEQFPAETAATYGFIDGIRFIEEREPRLWESKGMRIVLNAISSMGNLETLDYALDSIQNAIPTFNVYQINNILRRAEDNDVPIEFAEHILERLQIDLNEEEPLQTDEMEDFKNGGTGFIRTLDKNDLADEFRRRVYVHQLYNGMPLLRACYFGKIDMAELYLRHGADPVKIDSHGNTAFDAVDDSRAVARTSAHATIKTMLQRSSKVVPISQWRRERNND